MKLAHDHTTTLRLRWENRTNHRYYEVWLARDFFDWVLTRVWGRIGASHGQVVHNLCADVETGLARIRQIANQRRRRGYDFVNTSDLSCLEDVLAKVNE